MDPTLRRDCLLAVAALGGLSVIAVITDAIGILFRPLPVLVGAVGTFVLEALFLRYHVYTRALWQRRGIQVLSFVLLLGVGILAIRLGTGWLLASLAWGLVAYLGLVGAVAAGLNNPISRLVN